MLWCKSILSNNLFNRIYGQVNPVRRRYILKEQKKMPSKAESISAAIEECAKDEALASHSESQADRTLPADRKVMATHGFLKTLSTIKRR